MTGANGTAAVAAKDEVEPEIDLSSGVIPGKKAYKPGSAYMVKDKYRVTALPSVEKGDNDWRDYRAIVLENGMQCLAVQDVHSKTTAMAATVHVGASADPRDLSGLAHFCEHMCFLGSSKYPSENAYKQHVSQHGGRSNASTSMRFTTYKFDITAASPEAVETAVDMFSHFFLDPLFTESGTAREVAAVDSENSKNLINDARRRLQIFKNEASPNHHYSKFSTGNAVTLKMPWAAAAAEGGPEATPKAAAEDASEVSAKTEPTKDQLASAAHVRLALLSFHQFHYRPDNMSVVLVGPQSLDTLEEWMVSRFATMAAPWQRQQSHHDDDDDDEFEDAEEEEEKAELRHLIARSAADAPLNARFGQPPARSRPAFAPPKNEKDEAWPLLITSLPLKQIRKLSLSFPLPPIPETDVDRAPTSFLSHILGHEGAGSAFAALQNRGWITALSAGNRIQHPDQTVFQIDVSLTPEGEVEWKRVVALLLEQCRLVKDAIASYNAAKEKDKKNHELHHVWEEMTLLSRLRFHQTSPGSAYDAAPPLSQNLLMYGAAKCKSAGYHLDDHRKPDPAVLQDFGSRLTPSNCILERSSQAAWKEAEEEGSGKRCTEPWYGIDYFKKSFAADAALLESWTTGSQQTTEKKELHLPLPNRFLPRSLDLCADLPPEARKPRIEEPMGSPELLVDDSSSKDADKMEGRLWHRLDDRYALPKASISLLFRSPMVEHAVSPETDEWKFDSTCSILSSLLVSVFADAMAQETYDAELANLRWSLSKSSWGFTLTCSGYSDRLADLALAVLKDFSGVDSFWKRHASGPFFEASRDKLLRSLQSFLVSQRADSHAVYYRDLFLSSEGGGIADSIAAAQAATLESLQRHHANLVASARNWEMDCLYTGNVGKEDAKAFYQQVSDMWNVAATEAAAVAGAQECSIKSWIPGPLERIFPPQDVELHFASQNPEDENGAVLVTYQSPIPSYRGDVLDTANSSMRLKSTAAIRLLCHMLREPLFDELRTKQQLGYIVTSYYDLGYSTSRSSLSSSPTETSQMDFIVVNIVSRRASPTNVMERIDVFLQQFRQHLEELPETEIQHHISALAIKLRKPIQKLDTEVGLHFGKIRRFAPQALLGQRMPPWDLSETMAAAMEGLTRQDLIQAWDRVVTTNARVVSCVYGKTFPLAAAAGEGMATTTTTTTTTLSSSGMLSWLWGRPGPLRVGSVEEIVEKRKGFGLFDDLAVLRRQSQKSSSFRGAPIVAAAAAVAVVAAVGGYYLGWFSSSSSLSSSNEKASKQSLWKSSGK